MTTQRNPPPLLTQRSAIVLVVAVLVGVIFGCCTFMAYANPWTAVIAGLTAFGATAAGLHSLLE